MFFFDKVINFINGADISIFHEFHKPPYGGGNQFLIGLRKEFRRRNFRVENNKISEKTKACLFNSFNFNFDQLRRMKRGGCKMVHRVDGPIGLYRGRDEGIDKEIAEINHEIADVTIFQSNYSLMKHIEMGFHFKSPTVIMNAADPDIFHPHGRISFSLERKVRLISTSWSDNPNKGTEIYQWLDENLDWGRFEYNFIGRSSISFKNIKHIKAVPSKKLANLLRQHDIYITASRNDPCSNGLIEALSCGLPAIYLNSGGHPEIVGKAGLGFNSKEEIPSLLNKLIEEYYEAQKRISLLSLKEVADRYLNIMGFN